MKKWIEIEPAHYPSPRINHSRYSFSHQMLDTVHPTKVISAARGTIGVHWLGPPVIRISAIEVKKTKQAVIVAGIADLLDHPLTKKPFRLRSSAMIHPNPPSARAMHAAMAAVGKPQAMRSNASSNPNAAWRHNGQRARAASFLLLRSVEANAALASVRSIFNFTFQAGK